MPYCPNCNAELPEDSLFCPSCGTNLTEPQVSAPTEETGIEKPVRHKKAATLFASISGILLLLVIAIIFIALNQEITPFSDDPVAISTTSRSVVMLNCYDEYNNLLSTGSGFAFFEDGVIVTNYHVVDGDVYSIKVSTEDQQKFRVSAVIVADEEKDIAILQTNVNTGLPLLQSGNSQNLQKGEKVVAVGSPLGLMNSVSTGVFSTYIEDCGMNVLQFSAAISSGSSGGALFNDKGEVLGITFASYEDGQNLNLAIPIEEVTTLWNKRTEADKQSIDAFYAARPHVYTVDYVIENYKNLLNKSFYVEGWVLSHNVHGESTYSLAGAWCTLYSSSTIFPSFQESHSTATDAKIPNYEEISVCLLTSAPQLFDTFDQLHTGSYIRAKVSIEENMYGIQIHLYAEEIQQIG